MEYFKRFFIHSKQRLYKYQYLIVVLFLTGFIIDLFFNPFIQDFNYLFLCILLVISIYLNKIDDYCLSIFALFPFAISIYGSLFEKYRLAEKSSSWVIIIIGILFLTNIFKKK